jgi:hypothetical protein
LRGLVDQDAGLDRQPDQKRRVLGVLADELDPDRQALDDLHEVARGVLRREERGRRAGAGAEAGDAPLEDHAGVRVDADVDRVADPDRRELGLLEICVDPYIF